MLAILHNAGVVDLDATVVEQAHQLNSFHRSCTHIAILIQPTQVELVPGYGIDNILPSRDWKRITCAQ